MHKSFSRICLFVLMIIMCHNTVANPTLKGISVGIMLRNAESAFVGALSGLLIGTGLVLYAPVAIAGGVVLGGYTLANIVHENNRPPLDQALKEEAEKAGWDLPKEEKLLNGGVATVIGTAAGAGVVTLGKFIYTAATSGK